MTINATPSPIAAGTAPFSWRYYPGQLDYLSRVACKDAALIAADVGTGKTLMATSLIRLKLERTIADQVAFDGRALIVAPQGTIRNDTESDDGEEGLSQWRQELLRFAPHIPVWDIFEYEDYERIVRRYGQLPPGIYLSYFEAMFRNGAREYLPEKWDHFALCKSMGWDPGKTSLVFRAKHIIHGHVEEFGEDRVSLLSSLRPDQLEVGDALGCDYEITHIKRVPAVDYSEGVGATNPDGRAHHAQCIVTPCLSTRIDADHAVRAARLKGTLPGSEPCVWDLVALDEAHVACNLDAQLTRSFIRLQPRYRYLLTATPIPNIVTNMFSLMGWLCVPDWYLGSRRNAAWPYAREDLGRFNSTFLCEERDYTQEEINTQRNPRWRGKCIKISPVLSSPAQLLKLLKRNMAYISKEACNPNVVPCQVVDVRVPMGEQQAALYTYFTNRSNVPGKNAMRRAGVQITLLRNACGAPKDFSREIRRTVADAPECASNFNPKTVAVLQLIRECLDRGEQIVIISSRTEQTDEYYFRIASAIGQEKLARIDSTVLARDHAGEAQRFKDGKARVMFMGMRCAKAYSFERCPNMVVASLEYSFGSLHQAKGRIWRVNSVGSKVLSAEPGSPERQCRVWCVLTKGSIEETMYDVVATKQDAATICLLGRRVPRDFKPVDLDEVLAKSMEGGAVRNFKAESECEQKWPEIMDALTATQRVPAWLKRKRISTMHQDSNTNAVQSS